MWKIIKFSFISLNNERLPYHCHQKNKNTGLSSKEGRTNFADSKPQITHFLMVSLLLTPNIINYHSSNFFSSSANSCSECSFVVFFSTDYYVNVKVKVIISLLSYSLQPMDCSLPGSFVCGILQARILERIAIPFSRRSSWSGDQTLVSCTAGRFFTFWATRELYYIDSSWLFSVFLWMEIAPVRP